MPQPFGCGIFLCYNFIVEHLFEGEEFLSSSSIKNPDKRIYVCHTYYHVFVTILKELNLPEEKQGNATLVLSKMSNDFEDLKTRVEKSGIFESVIEFDEKRDTFFPELMELKKDRGNVVKNMYYRILYTKAYAKLEAPYVPVDFRQYGDIYVFCDGDPIGKYLNQNRIRYHAVEDGLDTLKPCVQAHYDNRGFFKLKKFMSMQLNLIFMCDGYSKYCIDMEVNDTSVIDDDFYKYKEVRRQALMDALSDSDREKLISIFIRDMDSFRAFLSKGVGDGILLLTEPLCTLDIREKIFNDIIDTYKGDGTIFIKPHPRDELDYSEKFPGYWVFDRTLPMEMFKLFKEVHFKKVVGVYTQLGMIDFADEKIMLGHDFMDNYEDPDVHRKGEKVKAEFKK